MRPKYKEQAKRGKIKQKWPRKGKIKQKRPK